MAGSSASGSTSASAASANSTSAPTPAPKNLVSPVWSQYSPYIVTVHLLAIEFPDPTTLLVSNNTAKPTQIVRRLARLHDLTLQAGSFEISVHRPSCRSVFKNSCQRKLRDRALWLRSPLTTDAHRLRLGNVANQQYDQQGCRSVNIPGNIEWAVGDLQWLCRWCVRGRAVRRCTHCCAQDKTTRSLSTTRTWTKARTWRRTLSSCSWARV
jgi:hypothetical protein